MNVRNEITVARLRCGLSVSIAAALSGVFEAHLDNFERQLGGLSQSQIESLRTLYADMESALDQCSQLPNMFDAKSVEYFICVYRGRREARQRQQKFLDDNLLTPCGRPDQVKIAKNNAEAEQEAARRKLEKARAAVDNAKATVASLEW